MESRSVYPDVWLVCMDYRCATEASLVPTRAKRACDYSRNWGNDPTLM